MRWKLKYWCSSTQTCFRSRSRLSSTKTRVTRTFWTFSSRMRSRIRSTCSMPRTNPRARCCSLLTCSRLTNLTSNNFRRQIFCHKLNSWSCKTLTGSPREPRMSEKQPPTAVSRWTALSGKRPSRSRKTKCSKISSGFFTKTCENAYPQPS